MAKRLFLLTIITFAMLVFACSCSAVKVDRIESGVEDKATFTPAEVGADRMAPAGVQPGEVEPVRAEPNPSEPAEGPSREVVGQAPPYASEPNESEPNNVRLDRATLFHAKCDEILKEFVDDKGMVDYRGLRRKRLELRALLNQFDNLDPNEYKSWPKEDKIAFWINAYNLQKLKVVADNYPIEPSSRILTIYWGPSSIRHLEQKITRHKFLVMDEEFTFAAIEKRFFRGEFDDPRVFFALSNACMSSPPLRNEPYCGSRLDEQLDEQTRKFLAGPLAFHIDRDKRKVYLSALFQLSSYGKQFAEKFAIDRKFKDHSPATRAVLNFICSYVSKQDVSFLEVGNYNIEYMTYDWTINDGS